MPDSMRSEVTYEQRFIRLISGETSGVVAVLLRLALRLLSVSYRLIIACRNTAFDAGLKRTHPVELPVIAVGNVTTGGTGKTPVVALLVNMLRSADHRPGIISRGYRADASGMNDEQRVLARLCPDTPHAQNPDRIAAAQQLIDSTDVDVLVLDDAFQHRRIQRDLNVVLIDATSPFGFGYLLPRGLLREPLSALRRADTVFVTRADAVSRDALAKIEQTILQHNNNLQHRIHRVSFRPARLVAGDGSDQPIDAVRGQLVVVMTGIGNPSAFEQTCRSLGAEICQSHFFPDHHHYSADEVKQITEEAAQARAIVLTTLKDLVKIEAPPSSLMAVDIQCVFEAEASEQIVRDELLTVAKMNWGSTAT